MEYKIEHCDIQADNRGSRPTLGLWPRLKLTAAAVLYFRRMSDSNKSVLDKAESLARRILEKLGAKVDGTLGADGTKTLSAREVGDLTSRIERVIEAHLREDKEGVKRLAPNHYKVLFTYEEANRLSPAYIEALAGELEANIFEYVNNRRYETRGSVSVETGRDLFAKTTVIKALFEGDPEVAAPAGLPLESAPQPRSARAGGARKVTLSTPAGTNLRHPAQTGRRAFRNWEGRGKRPSNR